MCCLPQGHRARKHPLVHQRNRKSTLTNRISRCVEHRKRRFRQSQPLSTKARRRWSCRRLWISSRWATMPGRANFLPGCPPPRVPRVSSSTVSRRLLRKIGRCSGPEPGTILTFPWPSSECLQVQTTLRQRHKRNGSMKIYLATPTNIHLHRL